MRRLLAVAALSALASVANAQTPSSGERLIPDDVPREFARATQVFTDRLNRLHPPGSPLAGLETALLAEGFELEGDTAARLTQFGIVCRPVWIVSWTTDGDAIATIEGQRGGICL